MRLKTRLRSAVMRHIASERFIARRRQQARGRRIKRGDTPRVLYFHQVDDPYSHLAVQKLDLLRSRYELDFQPYLVSMPTDAYLGSPTHFRSWAANDARHVAAGFDASFTPQVDAPTPAAVEAAQNALAPHLGHEDFAAHAMRTGAALWKGQSDSDGAHTGSSPGRQAISAGNALRDELGHYQGAMFYFEGEWYWGLDRLHLLEQRLTEEGFSNQPGAVCVPEPQAEDTSSLDASSVLLEYFPSLRSPYTAIGHRRVLQLIARTGVNVQLRPVMPMMMRGVPAPRAKQQYIMLDAAREGRAHGAAFGRIVDPFGDPVKRAFRLFGGAAELQRGIEFVTAYLNAAWFDGIDITRERGLQQVADDAELDWGQLCSTANQVDWESMLEDNLQGLTAANLWGVPSFRVSGGGQDGTFACWGQDRIWRVENEIAARAAGANIT